MKVFLVIHMKNISLPQKEGSVRGIIDILLTEARVILLTNISFLSEKKNTKLN